MLFKWSVLYCLPTLSSEDIISSTYIQDVTDGSCLNILRRRGRKRIGTTGGGGGG